MNYRGLLGLSLALILLLTACTAGSTSQVRSIESVTADQPPQIVNITTRDAVLDFQSSIPLACSVVYGETTEYGMISTDTDMAGGAHSDHNPLLTGLKPDTEYHFRVQGTDANGVLYQSEDMTFTTPPQSQSAETNWASIENGASLVDVSSNFQGAANDEQWGALGAIDGNRGSAWSSDGDGDRAYIEIQLAQPIQLSGIEVWSRSMSDGSARIQSFIIVTGQGEELGPFEMDDPTQSQRFPVEATAERIRIEVEQSTGGNVGLVEFAAYGEPVGES